jgi:membrane-associated protease RseP (regulator of RpoE activity)
VNPYLGYEIALLAVVVYAGIVYALWAAGKLGPDRTFSLFGPALMIKTKRGRAALDRWGRFVRFWTATGDLGIVLAAVAMVAMVVVLILGAIRSFSLTAAQAPSVQEAVGLPGINPAIPIGYGIAALVVGIVLHELLHGVIARSQKIGVKSLGVLLCVVPIGAFVEQNDVDMLAAPRRKRDRVAAAGVLANFALAIVFFVAFSGLVASSVQPNATGVLITYVQSDTPASNLSIAPGDVITSINGTATTTVPLFESSLNLTKPNESVIVGIYDPGLGHVTNLTAVLSTNPAVKTRGFLGVEVLTTLAELKSTLVWPLGSSGDPLVGGSLWLALPFLGVEPVAAPYTGDFHVSGPLAGTNPTGFWIGANLLYWLAWMNLLLGFSNALPLVPLDGGLLFRDFATSLAARFKTGWSEARLEAFGGRAVVFSSLLVLFLLLCLFVVPRLV